jgi:hypothetical protein
MRNTVDFGGGTLTSNGFSDIYVANFNSAGAHQWSASYGTTTGTDKAHGVAIDGTGNVLVTGTFYDDMDFGGGTVTFDGDPLNFDRNIFAALYDGSGAHLFSEGWGTTPLLAYCEFDSGDQMVIHGYGAPSIDMGGGTLSPADLFVAKLEGVGGPPTGIGDRPTLANEALRVYPNPFNPVTTVEYVVATGGTVTMSVYDVSGRFVAELVADEWHTPGRYTAHFEAKSSGVYFARLRVGGSERVVKLVAVK